MNEKHATGTRRVIAAIESDEIREMVEADFQEADEQRLSKNPLNSPSNGYGGGIENSRIGRMGATR